MAIRRSALSFPLVKSAPGGDHWIGHGCGPIAPVKWLAARPTLCKRVTEWYVGACLNDVWDRSANAQELDTIARAGGKLSRRAKCLLNWWIKAGRPMPWRDEANRPYLELESDDGDVLWLNTPYDDMRVLEAYYRSQGRYASVVCPSKDERVLISFLPVVTAASIIG